MSTEYRNYHAKTFYNEILFETDNFIVVPSLGALVEGWLLIVPKKEYLSFQYLENDSLVKELENLSNYIGEIIEKEYGYVTMFEHGAKHVKSTVGCGVDYAHLHLVPINFDLILGLENFLNIRYNWNKINSLQNVFHSEKKTEYLYYKDFEGNSFLVNDKEIPSQLFRKVIASFLNDPEKFDWKEFHQEDNILKTIERFKKYSIIQQKVNCEI